MNTINPATNQFQQSMQSVDNKNERRFAQSVEENKLLDACKDFEAILLNKMMSTMRESIPEGGLFKKSFGEKIYQSMLDEEMTKQMAHGKVRGIADMLYQHLSPAIKPPAGEEPLK
ncbi:MAG: rod-binding protein [Deltaproteobacteria bacterium]|nr:rod-binding protein [Deltaproteobacteria bacterium]